MITAGLATIPERMATLPFVIHSLLTQVDRLVICANGYIPAARIFRDKKITLFSKQDYGDAGKFITIDNIKDIYFSCDDDIIYPKNYVSEMLKALNKYGNKTVITLHGATIKTPMRSFYKQKLTYHCKSNLLKDVHVNIPGTGVSCFDNSIVHLKFSDIYKSQQKNMADIHFAIKCQKDNIPIICRRHHKDWLQLCNNIGSPLYDYYHRTDYPQTQLVNNFDFKIF
ncbi:MAG: hypothetical protein O8C60_02585 [Candidatus Methanoperedens sp.]|nr:hypothetical protein [Candidatus Methanoperedens sp.]